MTKRKRSFRLDIDVCLSESLFEGHGLADIERILRDVAPAWSSALHIWRHREKRHPITDFARDVKSRALERGPLYAQLIEQYGPGDPRRTGSVEIRGASKELIVVLILDDCRFAPSSGWWLWGNTFHLQLCASRVGGEPAVDFARRFAIHACTELAPLYAHAQMSDEFDEKNISREGGGMAAIGVDASRYLPGLYWLNFFGAPYCDLIGKERLLSAPAHQTTELGPGVLLNLAADPATWNTPEYQATENQVRAHLGDKYFFNRHQPVAETAAPDFGLERLPRHPRFG